MEGYHDFQERSVEVSVRVGCVEHSFYNIGRLFGRGDKKAGMRYTQTHTGGGREVMGYMSWAASRASSSVS